MHVFSYSSLTRFFCIFFLTQTLTSVPARHVQTGAFASTGSTLSSANVSVYLLASPAQVRSLLLLLLLLLCEDVPQSHSPLNQHHAHVYNRYSLFTSDQGQNNCITDPCQNGGFCISVPGVPGYQCVCEPGYEGVHCETGENPLLLTCVHVRHNGKLFVSPV